jgi:hypothetical protein
MEEGVESVRANRKREWIVTQEVGEEGGGVPDRAATGINRPDGDSTPLVLLACICATFPSASHFTLKMEEP